MENQNESEILSWITQSIKDENFARQKIVLTGRTAKTDGYASDIVFAKVSGVDASGVEKGIDLAIKMGKQNRVLREQFSSLRECYIREILVYTDILPAFRKFQEEKNVVDCFEAVPKCYKTFLTDTAEVLVFENLRTQGYKMHKRSTPMNLQHIRLVLDNYAKFHAISFAFQQQKPEEYKALTSNYYPHNLKMIEQFDGLFEKSMSRAVENLKEASRADLAEQFEKLVDLNSLLDVLKDEVKHSVITHGDCHNNNFVFSYKDGDEDNPTGLIILDWQVSIQHSPAMDLSYFLYAVAGENLYKLPELLKFYHSKLSHYAKGMGTDLNPVYPLSTLEEDWRRYSFYGFAYITTFFELLLRKMRHLWTTSKMDRIPWTSFWLI